MLSQPLFLLLAFLRATLCLNLSDKSGRLFSNPFGILGHHDCSSDVQGGPKSGICYNEVECLVRGGQFSDYCGPPAFSGVCCVFVVATCDGAVAERVAHFTNAAFPSADTKPNVCLLKVKPIKDICWVRFDLIDFELESDADGFCLTDSMVIINSAGGEGGRVCGNKKGYSFLAKASQQGDELGLAVLVQSPKHLWNIRVSQVRCDRVQKFPKFEKCGLSGSEDGITRAVSSSSSTQSKKVNGRKVVKTKRGRASMVNEICDYDEAACDLMQALLHSNEFRHSYIDVNKAFSSPFDSSSIAASDRVSDDGDPIALLQKKFISEPYRPSFSSREVFCRSKFRPSSEAELLRPTSKIIDGTESPMHAFPWIASLQYMDKHFCGGNLVSNDYIMTAAHCMDFGKLPNFLENFTVVLGKHNLNNTNETGVETRHVSRVAVHWQFNNKPGSMGDFALLKLEKPVVFTKQISPVCLPEDPTQNFAKMMGIAAGWGVTEDGNLSDVLKQVEQNIIPNATCSETLGPVNLPISADQICTFKGPLGTESICSGDSGGPLMVRSGSHFVLVGLTSFSVTDCTAPFPAVFSRVSYFLDWAAAAISSEL